MIRNLIYKMIGKGSRSSQEETKSSSIESESTSKPETKTASTQENRWVNPEETEEETIARFFFEDLVKASALGLPVSDCLFESVVIGLMGESEVLTRRACSYAFDYASGFKFKRNAFPGLTTKDVALRIIRDCVDCGVPLRSVREYLNQVSIMIELPTRQAIQNVIFASREIRDMRVRRVYDQRSSNTGVDTPAPFIPRPNATPQEKAFDEALEQIMSGFTL